MHTMVAWEKIDAKVCLYKTMQESPDCWIQEVIKTKTKNKMKKTKQTKEKTKAAKLMMSVH